jgi:hypothetical protein
MRPASGNAKALVVGVYPSAFHVAWSPPAQFDPRDPSRRRRPFIGSLAVDVEPTVFWDGHDPTPARILEQWRQAVGFDDDLHGQVTIGNNGPSGAAVVREVLLPLNLHPEEVAFTDVVPWFFVKDGKGSQGEAMRQRFAPLAGPLGVALGSLPNRPTTGALVELASTGARREPLRHEILAAAAPLVITLGQEAVDAIRKVADQWHGTETRLEPSGYGTRVRFTIESITKDLLPLVHPGFARQTNRPAWRSALDSWKKSQDADGIR